MAFAAAALRQKTFVCDSPSSFERDFWRAVYDFATIGGESPYIMQIDESKNNK